MATHVLIPVDGSDPSRAAIEYVAKTYANIDVTLLHVVDPIEGVYTGVEGGYFDADAIDRATERGEDLLAHARDRLTDVGDLDATDITTVVKPGRPEHVIIEYAEDHGIDHIVLGSHGRTGFQRVLLGSVAETVVRRSPVPVTIVRDENPTSATDDPA